MKYNEFWKLLGSFWDNYETKEPIEAIWGSWVALCADKMLSLDQINKSKNIYTAPIYWRKLWVPFETSYDTVEYDELVNTEMHETSVFVHLDHPTTIGFRYIVPGSVRARTEFGVPIDLKNFSIDYMNGFISLVSEDVVSDGDQIIIYFTVAERALSGVTKLKNENIVFNSETVYVKRGDTYAKVRRNSSYTIDYTKGEIYLIDGESAIVQYKYINKKCDFPYKFKTPDRFVYTEKIYSNVLKKGKTYELNKDFVLDNGYLRFRTMPDSNRVWAEEAEFDIDNIYRVFGASVGYFNENSIDYYKAVFALIYFLQHAPTPRNIEGVCQALVGLPVAMSDEMVVDTLITENETNRVVTSLFEYNLGKYTPIVYTGQTLSPLQPLTDVIKVHDRLNSKTFVDLLLYADILKADVGFNFNSKVHIAEGPANLNEPIDLGYRYVIPSSISARQPNGDTVPMSLFSVDFFNGTVTMVRDIPPDMAEHFHPGDPVQFVFRVGEGISTDDPEVEVVLNFNTITEGSEKVYTLRANNTFELGSRTIDYDIDYKKGIIKLLKTNKGIIEYEYTTSHRADSDPQLFADTMFSKEGMDKLFAPWHTFILEIKDPKIFEDKTKKALVRWALQNKPAYTTFLMLFNYRFDEEIPYKVRREFNAMIPEYYTESLLGQPIALTDRDNDGRLLIPHVIGDTTVVDVRPHASEECFSTFTVYPGPEEVPPAERRFFGTDIFRSGSVISPYKYSNIVLRRPDGSVISPNDYTYNEQTHTVIFNEEYPYRFIYVDYTEHDKTRPLGITDTNYTPIDFDIENPRRRTTVAKVNNKEARLFYTTILFDTFKMFGANMADGQVTWSVSAKSQFIDGPTSHDMHFSESIGIPYSYGVDFTFDEQTNVIVKHPLSRLVEGQTVFLDYKFIDLTIPVSFPETTIEYTQGDENYTQDRERVVTSTIAGYFSPEDIYWDGQIRQDDSDLINECLDPGNPWGFRRNQTPNVPSIVPKYKSEKLQLDYLHTPASRYDYELLKRVQSQRYLELTPSSFLGADGEAPYYYRYALPDMDMFVNRLISVTSDEDMGFGVAGFGISPFGGSPSLKFEINYFEGLDFKIEHVQDGRNLRREIRFKTEPVFTYYYMLRYKPEDISAMRGSEIEIGLSTYIDSNGKPPYIHRYHLPEPLSYVDVLDYKTSNPDEYFTYMRGVDFEVEIWPERIIKFKTLPIDAIYQAREHAYYKYPRMEDALIEFSSSTPYTYLGPEAAFPHSFELPRNYSHIEILWSKANHFVNYKIDIDYVLFYHDANNKTYIRFKKMPEFGVYHPYHVFYRTTESIVNCNNREAVRYWDSKEYITHLRWLNRDQWTYTTEYYDNYRDDGNDYFPKPENHEMIVCARSYVDRSDWHGTHFWCGPGVPFGGWANRPEPGIPGETLAPIATSMN